MDRQKLLKVGGENMAVTKHNFTRQSLETLYPSVDGKRIYYYDTKVLGLELVVAPTGKKTFAFRKWINGDSRRVVLGSYDPLALQPKEFDENQLIVLDNNPKLTIEHARALAQAVHAQMVLGQSPRKIKRLEKPADSLEDVFNAYLQNYAMDHTKTWKWIEECFHRYFAELKKRRVNEISRAEVQSLINKIGKERGHTTANRALEIIRAVINKGKAWNIVTGENPAAGVCKFKLKSRKRFVTESELPRLLKSINEEESSEVRDYVLISLSTGARKGNVLSMRWEDVDLKEGTWVIPDTKNGTSQTILLTTDELRILGDRFASRKSFEWVFPGPDPNKHLKDPKKGWARILKRANIEDLHLHDLRRTLGSYMAMSGVSLSVIGNALNHKDVSTTRKVYAQSALEAEKTAGLLAHQRIFATPNTSKSIRRSSQARRVEF